MGVRRRWERGVRIRIVLLCDFSTTPTLLLLQVGCWVDRRVKGVVVIVMVVNSLHFHPHLTSLLPYRVTVYLYPPTHPPALSRTPHVPSRFVDPLLPLFLDSQSHLRSQSLDPISRIHIRLDLTSPFIPMTGDPPFVRTHNVHTYKGLHALPTYLPTRSSHPIPARTSRFPNPPTHASNPIFTHIFFIVSLHLD